MGLEKVARKRPLESCTMCLCQVYATLELRRTFWRTSLQNQLSIESCMWPAEPLLNLKNLVIACETAQLMQSRCSACRRFLKAQMASEDLQTASYYLFILYSFLHLQHVQKNAPASGRRLPLPVEVVSQTYRRESRYTLPNCKLFILCENYSSFHWRL